MSSQQRSWLNAGSQRRHDCSLHICTVDRSGIAAPHLDLLIRRLQLAARMNFPGMLNEARPIRTASNPGMPRGSVIPSTPAAAFTATSPTSPEAGYSAKLDSSAGVWDTVSGAGDRLETASSAAPSAPSTRQCGLLRAERLSKGLWLPVVASTGHGLNGRQEPPYLVRTDATPCRRMCSPTSRESTFPENSHPAGRLCSYRAGPKLFTQWPNDRQPI